MHGKKGTLAAALLAAALLLSGCTAPSSADSLFTLPQLPIEYTDLARQIDDLIESGYEYASPTSGRNIQSVQMVDLDGDGDEEAVAFFRRSGDEKPLKILIYRASDETYEHLCTVESSGTGVESVYYRDLTGDGKLELVVGWRISSDVQTVAVYSVSETPATLMQSSYVRYSIEELDGDGVPSLLIFRPDSEGNSVAEFYSWRDNVMSVSYSVSLTGTMAELARGSVVSGRLGGRKAAVFVTSVTDKNVAVTDILTCPEAEELVNLALDAQTGKSGISYPYAQLRPQDIDSDGCIEIPAPAAAKNGQPTGVISWLRFNVDGDYRRVMTTYHNVSGGWYFILPEDWLGRVQINTSETGQYELQTSIAVDGHPVCILYTLTGENRENRALRGGRMVLKRQTGTVYAGEIFEAGDAYGLTEDVLRHNFKLIGTQWSTG